MKDILESDYCITVYEISTECMLVVLLRILIKKIKGIFTKVIFNIIKCRNLTEIAEKLIQNLSKNYFNNPISLCLYN